MLEHYIKLLVKFKEDKISLSILSIRNKMLHWIKEPFLSDKAKEYFRTIQKRGEPFIDFETEPKQIVQIKEVLNALYHAELAFQHIESINLDNWTKQIPKIKPLFDNIVTHAYKACYLLTHLDIDFQEILGPELFSLLGRLESTKEIINQYTKDEFDFETISKLYPLAYQAGTTTGIAIDQLKPNADTLDYEFLTHFSAVLPGYIQEFTKKVETFTNEFSENQPTLNKEQLTQIQEAAFKLLHSIENLKSGDILISLKAPNYIRIIRTIITLSMSTIQQIGYMNKSSQVAVCGELRRIKYELLPQLLSFADQLEDQALLKPGTISKPLMDQLKPLYGFLVLYASKVIDFSSQDKELRDIEDPTFNDLRLESTYKRITESKIKTLANVASISFHEFFKIIENIKFPLYELPAETKTILIKEYKLFESYVKAIDIDLNNQIISQLQFNPSFVRRHIPGFIKKLTDKLTLDKLMTLNEQLKVVFLKEEETHRFHIQLNQDIMDTILDNPNLIIFPAAHSFMLDELTPLKLTSERELILNVEKKDGHNLITNTKELTLEELLLLYNLNFKTHQKIQKAHNAFLNFMNTDLFPLRSEFDAFDSTEKDKLRHWFSLFEPFIQRDEIESERTKELLNSFKLDSYEQWLSSLDFLENHHESIKGKLQELENLTNERQDIYLNLITIKLRECYESKPLECDESAGKRAHFLLKHTAYSEAIQRFKLSFLSLKEMFNETFKRQFTPSENKTELPFSISSLESKNLSSSLTCMKRLYNEIHHLEQIFLELEQLDHKSKKVTYVYHIIKIYGHIRDTISDLNDMSHDPFISFVLSQFKDQALNLYQNMMQVMEIYNVKPDAISLTSTQVENKAVENNSLWYVIHSLMIIPEQIKAALSDEPLSEEVKQDIQIQSKKAVLNIEKIITNSNSYFKLFLETPTMYRLYHNLKERLQTFATISRSAAFDHLEELNTVFFTDLLKEVDEWEDKLCLKPGLLTGPMKMLLDEFYKGLLEPFIAESEDLLSHIASQEPILRRLEAVDNRLRQVENSLRDPVFKILKNLNQAIETNLNSSRRSRKTNGQILIELFNEALPILLQAKTDRNLVIDGHTVDENPELKDLDLFLKKEVTSPEKGELSLVGLAQTVCTYYQIHKKNLKVEVATTKEKFGYLGELQLRQLKYKKEIVAEYREKLFDKHLKLISLRHVGLLNTGDEYNSLLKIYLQTHKKTILEASQHAINFNNTIHLLMQQNTLDFVRSNYLNFYHLESIRAQLDKFSVYFSNTQEKIQKNNSFFETNSTLSPKIELIDRLKSISTQTELPVTERIKLIQQEVQKDSFRMTMLSHHRYDTLSFSWILQRVLSLLSLLHIHKPKHLLLTKELTKKANENPSQRELLRRFGMFSEAPTLRSYEPPEPAIPAL